MDFSTQHWSWAQRPESIVGDVCSNDLHPPNNTHTHIHISPMDERRNMEFDERWKYIHSRDTMDPEKTQCIITLINTQFYSLEQNSNKLRDLTALVWISAGWKNKTGTVTGHPFYHGHGHGPRRRYINIYICFHPIPPGSGNHRPIKNDFDKMMKRS